MKNTLRACVWRATPFRHYGAVIYGLDIETDTTIDGRNPGVSRIVAAALVPVDGDALVLRHQDERELIGSLVEHTSSLSANDVVCTWNGSGFDIPFITIRSEILGINCPWDTWKSSRPTKYDPVGYDFSLRARIGLASHMDVAPAYKEVASSLGCAWSLKPVCTALGFSPLSVDRERIHEMTVEEIDAYVASDAFYTAVLGQFILKDSNLWID